MARFVALALLPVATAGVGICMMAALVELDLTPLLHLLSLEGWLAAYAVFGAQSVLWALMVSTQQHRSRGFRCAVGAALGGVFGGTPALAGADPTLGIVAGLIVCSVAVVAVDWALPFPSATLRELGRKPRASESVPDMSRRRPNRT